eukprot:TRINITY_DN4374_c0_g1_i1.p1 TRINITY_DN4374_c0_g1~~TRINITY_DN4374_c0_g1_i1.p1  ORF type:complete len:1416 (+),score=399.52 TRINITY_DN4374_c0_g1_i1:73-4248(+)
MELGEDPLEGVLRLLVAGAHIPALASVSVPDTLVVDAEGLVRRAYTSGDCTGVQRVDFAGPKSDAEVLAFFDPLGRARARRYRRGLSNGSTGSDGAFRENGETSSDSGWGDEGDDGLDIVAVFVTATPQLSVDYLDIAGLDALVSSIKPPGLLQKYTNPRQYHSMTQCLWTPYVLLTEQRQNVHDVADLNVPIHERVATAQDTPHSVEVAVPAATQGAIDCVCRGLEEVLQQEHGTRYVLDKACLYFSDCELLTLLMASILTVRRLPDSQLLPPPSAQETNLLEDGRWPSAAGKAASGAGSPHRQPAAAARPCSGASRPPLPHRAPTPDQRWVPPRRVGSAPASRQRTPPGQLTPTSSRAHDAPRHPPRPATGGPGTRRRVLPRALDLPGSASRGEWIGGIPASPSLLIDSGYDSAAPSAPPSNTTTPFPSPRAADDDDGGLTSSAPETLAGRSRPTSAGGLAYSVVGLADAVDMVVVLPEEPRDRPDSYLLIPPAPLSAVDALETQLAHAAEDMHMLLQCHMQIARCWYAASAVEVMEAAANAAVAEAGDSTAVLRSPKSPPDAVFDDLMREQTDILARYQFERYESRREAASRPSSPALHALKEPPTPPPKQPEAEPHAAAPTHPVDHKLEYNHVQQKLKAEDAVAAVGLPPGKQGILHLRQLAGDAGLSYDQRKQVNVLVNSMRFFNKPGKAAKALTVPPMAGKTPAQHLGSYPTCVGETGRMRELRKKYVGVAQAAMLQGQDAPVKIKDEDIEKMIPKPAQKHLIAKTTVEGAATPAEFMTRTAEGKRSRILVSLQGVQREADGQGELPTCSAGFAAADEDPRQVSSDMAKVKQRLAKQRSALLKQKLRLAVPFLTAPTPTAKKRSDSVQSGQRAQGKQQQQQQRRTKPLQKRCRASREPWHDCTITETQLMQRSKEFAKTFAQRKRGMWEDLDAPVQTQPPHLRKGDGQRWRLGHAETWGAGNYPPPATPLQHAVLLNADGAEVIDDADSPAPVVAVRRRREREEVRDMRGATGPDDAGLEEFDATIRPQRAGERERALERIPICSNADLHQSVSELLRASNHSRQRSRAKAANAAAAAPSGAGSEYGGSCSSGWPRGRLGMEPHPGSSGSAGMSEAAQLQQRRDMRRRGKEPLELTTRHKLAKELDWAQGGGAWGRNKKFYVLSTLFDEDDNDQERRRLLAEQEEAARLESEYVEAERARLQEEERLQKEDANRLHQESTREHARIRSQYTALHAHFSLDVLVPYCEDLLYSAYSHILGCTPAERKAMQQKANTPTPPPYRFTLPEACRECAPHVHSTLVGIGVTPSPASGEEGDAAMYDIPHDTSVISQFIGRFTRFKADLTRFFEHQNHDSLGNMRQLLEEDGFTLYEAVLAVAGSIADDPDV